MIEHGSGETPADDDPRIADRALEEGVKHPGVLIFPGQDQCVEVLREETGLAPGRGVRAVTRMIDIFHAGATLLNTGTDRYVVWRQRRIRAREPRSMAELVDEMMAEVLEESGRKWEEHSRRHERK